MTGDFATHEVVNQPGPPPRRNPWESDAALRAHAAGADAAALTAYGAMLAREDVAEAARRAERKGPELVTHDRAGRRVDRLEFDPSYHLLMREGLGHGYAARAWEGGGNGHLTHAVMVYLHSQVEPGTCCPMTMTYAAIPALAADPVLAAEWQPRLSARHYDPRALPLAAKRGATLGMAMTEKQGGSDVRANATRAEATGDGSWRLTGHKWFCSAPMSDGFLTLAQTPEGLSCFLVPRWLEEGPNAIRLMRLKDKLGNRANGSAEIEYEGAAAHLLGAPGQGVRAIIEMVHHTRLDTAMAPAGLMRAALNEAHHWAVHRTAFQRRLVDQPLMRAVLADLALDWEASLALGLHVARAFDDPGGRPLARIGVALAKFLSNKRCPGLVAEAMEVMGGMGYVEDTALPMLYREAPLNGIWEGSGNVICLDILRSLSRAPEREALEAALSAARGQDGSYDRALSAHRARWGKGVPEAAARRFAEETASLLAAAALLARAPAPVAEGFIATRLAGRRGIYGTAEGLDEGAILSRLAAG